MTENRSDVPPKTDEAFRELERLGCKIHWFKDGHFEIPTHFELSPFVQERKDQALEFLQMLKRYVEKPAIEDWFDDHSQRRKWWGDLSPEFQRVYDQNRLRGNTIFVVFHAMDFLVHYLDPGDSRAKKIQEVRDNLEDKLPTRTPGGYNFTVQYADQVADSAIDVLNLFAVSPQKARLG